MQNEEHFQNKLKVPLDMLGKIAASKSELYYFLDIEGFSLIFFFFKYFYRSILLTFI